MNALLDTHALLLWVYDPDRLSRKARALIGNNGNRLYWSVASTWEVAIKVGLGKLQLDGPVAEVLPQELARQAIEVLPIEQAHALRVAELPRHHGDPFDRLLIAQAQVEHLPLVTADKWPAAYGVEVVW